MEHVIDTPTRSRIDSVISRFKSLKKSFAVSTTFSGRAIGWSRDGGIHQPFPNGQNFSPLLMSATRLDGAHRGDRPSRKWRDDLSSTSFPHGGFPELAEADLTDAHRAQLGAIDQRGSSRPMPNAPANSSSMSPKSGARSERIRHICHDERLTVCQNGERELR
jgi:hypothetical protein